MATRAASRIASRDTGNGKLPSHLSKVTASIEFVSPVDAEIYLEANQKNYRKLGKLQVDKLANDMTLGLWRFDGTPVCFTEEGVLSDGQHRLRAIVQSGCGQWCLVVRNLPVGAESLPSKDTGKKRSASDHILYSGHKHSTIIAGAVRFLHRLHCKIEKQEPYAISDSIIVELQNRFPAVRDAAAVSDCGFGSPSAFTAFYYLAAIDNQQLADESIDIAACRREASTFHPFSRLRHTLTEARNSSRLNRTHVDQMEQFNLTMSAWLHVKKGNLSLKLLRPSSAQMPQKMEQALREFHI